jgi:hypothetical protein
VIVGETPTAPMLSFFDMFPTVDIKQAVPREVPVLAQACVPVPLSKRLVSFQPVRHTITTPMFEPIISIRLVSAAYLLVSRGFRRIQKQQATGYQRYSNDLVHIDLRFVS